MEREYQMRVASSELLQSVERERESRERE